MPHTYNDKKTKILIVEDDLSSIQDMESRLKCLGYSVRGEALSAEKAIDIIDRYEPDLVLMDIIQKGNMDGIDAAAVIEDRWGIPVVFLASDEDIEALKRVYRTRPCDYILKPVSDQELRIKIRMALFSNQEKTKNITTNKMIQELEKRYRGLFDNLNDLVMIHNLEGTLLSVNAAVTRISGYSFDELVGRPVSDFIVQRYRSLFQDFYMMEIIEHGISEGVFLSQAKDGSEHYIEYRNIRIMPKNGEPFVFGIGRDITERINIEHELKQAKEQAELVFKLVPSAIFTVDNMRRVTSWNRQAEKITGFMAEEVLGKTCPLFALYPCKFRCGLFAKEIDKPIIASECTIRRKDGQQLTISKNVDIFRDVEGNIIGGIESFEDITDRKRIEKELSEAREKAEMANQAKTEFLANMSHEIRTPMNAIIGMVNLVMDTDLAPRQREYLEDVQLSSKRLLCIINDILDLSAIEAGRMKLNNNIFSLRTDVESIINAMTDEAKEKGISLTHHIESDVVDGLVGDVVRLRQIIFNLINNALKFTHEGGVHMLVRMVGTPSEDIHLCISVSDSGIGIPVEKQAEIFHPFTQADLTTSKKYGGTGLGLTISKHLAHMLGGELWIESQPGKGSTFYCTMRFKPYSPSEDEISLEASQEQPTSTDSNFIPLNKLQILLVEDNPINQKLAQHLLEKQGHNVTIANNGKEALNRFNNETFDLIFMDIQMPGMDGLEATAAIRDREKKGAIGHIPIIAMTAYTMEEDRGSFLAAGMDDYISKPIQQKELFRVTKRWVPSTDETSIENLNSPVDERIFDKSALLKLVDGNVDFMKELLELFLKQIPERMVGLRKAISTGDGQAITRAAHFIKGMSANLNTHSVTQASLTLERMGKSGDLTDADHVLRELEKLVERVKMVFTEILNKD